ncbi:TetR/AcrR family transcriptional regulator [Pseudonocardiaceae bacterium YIM PH 21723]|nr:TetR/AcrR family transcriptional regulator [Pseudonocardiaceae bacterium YIM PH 21723]
MTEYSGGGDPAKSMALLWRQGDKPGRSGLGAERIIATGIELADAEGLTALTMRKVAEKLGVGAMSLYTHVPGRAELLDAMVDTVQAEAIRLEDPPGDWRARLETVARDNWAMLHKHPWLLQIATTRAVLGPVVITKYDYELRQIDGIGLSDVDMDAVLTLVLGYVQGSARASVDARESERRTGLSDEQWWALHAPLLGKLINERDFPVASRVGSAAGQAHQSAYDPDFAFEFGLAKVLDGIAAHLAQLPHGPGS